MPRGKAGLNPQLLEAALEGLELQRQRLDGQIREVRGLLGTRGGARGGQTRSAAPAQSESGEAAPRKRTLSAAARRRIAAAQKKRWAEYRKGGGGTAAAESGGGRGRGKRGRRGRKRGRPAKKAAEAQG